MKSTIEKQIFALLLVLILVVSLVTPAFAAEPEDTEETESAEVTESTEEAEQETVWETIYVKDEGDLLELAENCRLNTWSVGKLVVLKADISLENTDFLPIPSFGGIFDGNGHTISGLHMTDSITPTGLFGQLQATGVIKNLTVSGSIVPSGDARYVGGIVGENYGTVMDCTFTGNVTGSDSVGGIAGVNGLTGKITGCEATGTVQGSDMTGGIAGYNLGIIGSCVNKASVNTVSVDPAIRPEDISLDFLTDLSKITTLDTSTASMDTGGIAGYSSGIIESCTNKAAIGYPHIGYNVGGIAGRSCGYIHNCENTAQIYGRKDVGGIAGQLEPYIAKNLTESALAKLERQLEELDVLLDQAMEHAEGATDSIVNRLNGIAGSMGAAGSAAKDIRTTGSVSSNVTGSGESSGEGSVTVTPIEGEKGGSITVGDGSVSVEIGGSVSSGVEGAGSTAGSGSLDAQTQISISTNLSGLSSAIYSMAGQMSMLSGEISGASDELFADVEQVRAKIGEITETAFDMILDDGEEDVIIDSSEINIDLVTLGKASECANSGSINGDINVGGITGAMAMEYELDPEDDITVSIDSSVRRKYEVKAIIQKCENTGTVTAKRNYAGGIAGKMDLGLIAQCESYGSVSSESGNYVGGIAGIAGSTVRHSFVKCTLSGKKYIGGIVGSGVEEDRNGDSSTVAACYAIVTITDYEQYAGAISGADAGIFLENYFVSGELAGINRMSYTGEAEPLTYDELIALFTREQEAEEELTESEEEAAEETVSEEEPEGGEETEESPDAETVTAVPFMELPDEFRKFTLKFVVDGEVIYSELFDYGASFGAEVFPEIPEKDGYFGYWDTRQLENLKFDTTVTAVYDPYITALTSTDQREGERPTFFVEGQFAEEDQLTVEAMALTSGAFDFPDGIWDAVCKSFTDLKLNTEVVEQWRLQIPSDGQSSHTVRYLPPDGGEDQMDVYICRDGKWLKTETEVISSYVTFQAEGSDVQIAVVSSIQVWWVWLIAAGMVLIVILAIIRLVSKMIRHDPEPPEEDEEEFSEEAEGEDFPVRVPPPVVPKKQRRWLTPFLVALALLMGIGGTAAFFLLPDLLTGKKAYDLLKEWSEKQELSMVLEVEAVIGETEVSVDADVYRTMVAGKQTTVICENGRTLCYSDGVVFLENGTAYQIGQALPDYSQLLEQTMAVYQYVELEKEDDSYCIAAEKENAKAILELLMPSAAEMLAETDSLTVELILDDGELEKIRFSGSGTLNDNGKTGYSVSAVLKLDSDLQPVEVPEAAAEAIASGEQEALEVLSEDLLRLVNGWKVLNDTNPLSAELTLEADCGPITLNETVDLFRWNTEKAAIFCIEENSYALYFTEDRICDSKGNSIPTAGASNTDAAKLLDIAYTICMNANAVSMKKGGQYTYTVSLDEDGMKQVAYAIAPEAEKLNINFESGKLILVMTEEKIVSVEIRVSGNAQIVLSSVDVSIGASLMFTEKRADVSLPEAVKEALQQ